MRPAIMPAVTPKRAKLPPTPFGIRVREIRTAKGIGSNDLDRRAKVAVGTTSRVESGQKQEPTIQTAEALAQGLGVSTDRLIVGIPVGPRDVDPDPTYPSRARAIAAARIVELREQAIEAVLRELLPEGAADPGAAYWLERVLVLHKMSGNDGPAAGRTAPRALPNGHVIEHVARRRPPPPRTSPAVKQTVEAIRSAPRTPGKKK